MRLVAAGMQGGRGQEEHGRKSDRGRDGGDPDPPPGKAGQPQHLVAAERAECGDHSDREAEENPEQGGAPDAHRPQGQDVHGDGLHEGEQDFLVQREAQIERTIHRIAHGASATGTDYGFSCWSSSFRSRLSSESLSPRSLTIWVMSSSGDPPKTFSTSRPSALLPAACRSTSG